MEGGDDCLGCLPLLHKGASAGGEGSRAESATYVCGHDSTAASSSKELEQLEACRDWREAQIEENDGRRKSRIPIVGFPCRCRLGYHDEARQRRDQTPQRSAHAKISVHNQDGCNVGSCCSHDGPEN
jgi:hypothetical protein